MSSALSLAMPTQIPWRLLATSQGMMDTSPTDRSFPPKWRSSLSIFCFRPEVDDELFPGSTVTYLKVVCSITGYMWDLFGALRRLDVAIDAQDGVSEAFIEDFDSFIGGQYWPCHGAMVQIAVFPGDDQAGDLSLYPHIYDFEPKKREMHELVSETGEAMSRSAAGLQIGKSNATTFTQESSESESGTVSGNVGVSKGVVGAGVGGSSTSQSGTKNGWSVQNVNMRTSDWSREQRESLSHTTQLSQLYQLLDSYHLGTNRALFVVFPRPHIIPPQLSEKPGSTWWSRKLEGIQEFFLVVVQPKRATKLCVHAHLETMHTLTTTKAVEDAQFAKTEVVKKIDYYNGWAQPTMPPSFEEIQAPAGSKIDMSRGKASLAGGNKLGYDEKIQRYEFVDHEVETFEDYIRVKVIPHPGPGAFGGLAGNHHNWFVADYTVYCISKEPISIKPKTVTDVDLFMTGRHLEGCLSLQENPLAGITVGVMPTDPNDLADYVTYEERVPPALRETMTVTPRDGQHATKLANELSDYMKERLVASVNSPNRYAAGERTLIETDFAARMLLGNQADEETERRIRTRPLRVSDVVEHMLTARQRRRLAGMTVGELIDTPAGVLARRLDLPAHQVTRLKLANLGLDIRDASIASRDGGEADAE